ncbi:FecR domain-containing protein [Rhodoferax sp.]|uniref:FecR domain-containing protein n=1 Tax=Rhodoferax sp. TaxID=50421 RepID=UPI00374C93A6
MTNHPSRLRIQALGRTGLLSLLLAAACTSASAADFIYTVQPGDHPWNLAQRYLKSPSLALRLRRLNNIPDEYRVMPGTRLRIPQEWLKLESAQVRLLAAVGDTTLAQGSAPPRSAVAGEMLQAPAALHTGADGSATLQFADGSRVLVRRDSELELRSSQQRTLGQASLVELALLQGSLENQVTHMSESGGRFEIRTPAAVAAVRGTQFRVYAQGNTMRTEVIEGAVQVANPGGQVTAQAAQGSLAQAGQSPSPPVALLPAPDVSALPERIERLPIDLPLTSLPGASGYRTQIAPDAQFTLAISDETSPTARMRARDVADGSYVLRVRGIDAQGLEGLNAERTLVVHARPEPPLLIEPAPESMTTATRPSFRWTQADPGWSYRLQIMAAGNPTPISDQAASGAGTQSAQDLEPGIYQWRVATVRSDIGQGPWGDAQPFRRVLPGPGVEIPQPKDGSLTLRWTAQPQTAHYRLQVARDNTFATPLVDAQTDSAQYALEKLQPGVHHVRIQAVAVDGYTGPWGSTQTFTVPEPEPSRWRVLLLLIPLLAVL